MLDCFKGKLLCCDVVVKSDDSMVHRSLGILSNDQGHLLSLPTNVDRVHGRTALPWRRRRHPLTSLCFSPTSDASTSW